MNCQKYNVYKPSFFISTALKYGLFCTFWFKSKVIENRDYDSAEQPARTTGFRNIESENESGWFFFRMLCFHIKCIRGAITGWKSRAEVQYFITLYLFNGFVVYFGKTWDAIHSTKLSGNFGPKLNGSVRSNRKSFEKTGPTFEVVLFSQTDRLEFWLDGSRPWFAWVR